MERNYEIRIENLSESETAQMLDDISNYVADAQVYLDGKPIAWGLVSKNDDPPSMEEIRSSEGM